ncbi:hypothetical protein [Actinomadura madurae]|uniref:hypothetical protein n=1 Tax=Actinomadura madurae TaxID=1993 RepID=UPI0020D24789|nr:hypothetical protein [Actinomadura madurae]MCQ0014142.1 hypothetical protein [Actinomadura madurae]
MTAADIARLAAVGRAAVSNWRRRHDDFPQPVGGTAASPTFSLAEVEDWLRGQGKLADSPVRERVWQTLRSAAARTPTSPTCSPSPAPASSGCGTNPAVT